MPRLKEDFLPGSPKAGKLRKLIREHIDMSYRSVSLNFPMWDEIEKDYRAYRPSDDEDKESLEKYGVQKIIIPIQFATIQTMLTFMMEVFTAVKPVLRVRGTDPATRRKSRVMEVALDYDYRNNRGYFLLQQWFFNTFRYGYGVMKNTWGTRTIIRKTLSEGPSSIMTIEGQDYEVPGPMIYQNNPFVVFEGNKWELTDNRNFFFDTRYPLSRFQEGVFCAERDMIHDHELIEMEEAGLFFNTTKIKGGGAYGPTRDTELGSNDHQRDRYGNRRTIEEAMVEAKKSKMHVNELIIIRLIPRDFDLSDEDRPQDYLFNLINDQWIVRAEPNPFTPRFPWNVCESYPDMLALMSQGVMELTAPLQSHLDFLFNSHMNNVRKAVNDRFLGDPSRIDLNDFLDPENVVVRLLPSAYGTNPAEALQQLNVVDITKGHFTDAQMLLELWERITGASSHMFGQISQGRRTAFELQGVFRQAGARMKMQADLFSCEGVAPLTEQMAILRQENMSMEQFMEVAGRTAADLGVSPDEIVEGFLKVRKNHLTGVFSYPAEEGVLPQDRAAASEILQETFNTVAQAPFLTQVFDPVMIFKEMIRQKGVHHIDEFLQQGIRAQSAIMTPQQIGEAMAAGKIQPMGVEGNRPPGRPNEGVAEDRGTLTMEGAMNGAGAAYQQ